MKRILIIAILIMTNIINETALAEKLDVDKMFSLLNNFHKKNPEMVIIPAIIK